MTEKSNEVVGRDDDKNKKRKKRIAKINYGEEILVWFFRNNDESHVNRLPKRVCVEFQEADMLGKAKMISKKLFDTRLRRVKYGTFEDKIVIVPYPGFPGLFHEKSNHRLFPHQLASLRMMWELEYPSNPSFGAVRGGILGDAPGLGKTVTMLAHILRTAGSQPLRPPQQYDSVEVDKFFKPLRRTSKSLTRDIIICSKGLRVWRNQFLKKNTVAWKLVNTIIDDVVNGELAKHLGLDELETYFRNELRSKLVPLGMRVSEVNQISWEFSRRADEIRSRASKHSRREMQTPKMRRAAKERQRIPSGATLVVVPDPLLEHWCTQTSRHVRLEMFQNSFGLGRGVGIVYVDGLGGDLRRPFVDHKKRRQRGYKDLPRAEDLASHLIVITTFSRCKEQSARETFLSIRWLRLVVDEGHILGDLESSVDVEKAIATFKKRRPGESYEYLKEKLRSAIYREKVTDFLKDIAAERRWILSGTPTTGDIDEADASSRMLLQLRNLLQWLRHPKYGASLSSDLEHDVSKIRQGIDNAKEAWKKDILLPFRRRDERGRERLLELLRRFVVRHRKSDLKLPQPQFIALERDVSRGELSDHEFQLRVDEAQATCIVEELKTFSKTFRKKTKAVVFSQNDVDLVSVSEQLISRLGTSRVAEYNIRDPKIAHLAKLDLEKFRTDRKVVRKCGICGFENHRESIRCDRILMEVEILSENQITLDEFTSRTNDEPQRIEYALQRRVLIEAERVVRIRRQDLTLNEYRMNARSWRQGDILNITLRKDGFTPRQRLRDWVTSWNLMSGLKHANRLKFEGPSWFFGELPSHSENDVDSKIVTVRLCKWQKCFKFHGAWYNGPKLVDQMLQEIKVSVPIMSLYNYGSHGLDLSFLTHIFLLEPIHDSALMDQIVSRAFRCGARDSVRVITIVVWDKDATAGEKRNVAGCKVCDFCFKQGFPSDNAAEDHMKLCSRNPKNKFSMDRYSMRYLYAEIKPPLQYTTTT